MPKIEVDVIDRSILKKLQENGRLSNVQLAAEVGLSESACLRRVKLLEENGIIDRYVMLINQVAIGKPGNVFVRVTLDGQQREKLAAFEAEVSRVSEVMECYLMAGDFDYLLRVITRDKAGNRSSSEERKRGKDRGSGPNHRSSPAADRGKVAVP